VGNNVLLSTTLYFLAIWGGTGSGIKHIKAKMWNYLWVGENKPCRARVARQTCCLKKWDEGLGLVDPTDALVALMTKWLIVACEPGVSNFKTMLRHCLARY
jgi:hypothetical protein